MAAGLIGVVVFVAVEERVRYPLMDLSLFRIREFDLMTAAGTVGNMGLATAIFTSMILLQSVHGLSAGQAGIAFLGFSLGVAVASQVSGRVEWVPSWGAGVHALENALRGVLIAAGALALAMSALLVVLGRRSQVPRQQRQPPQQRARRLESVQRVEHCAQARQAGEVVPRHEQVDIR